jgi:hypothetical protein|nr:MAG TPA: hypothetical protein [Caudoviricetes sp.]
MNNVIINKETTVKKALAGNGVLAVGRLANKREVERQQAMSTNKVIMAGRLPNRRELGMVEDRPTLAVVKPTIANEERVEIPSFLLKAQEERRMARAKKQRQVTKKKAPVRKPSLKTLIVNTLKSL